MPRVYPPIEGRQTSTTLSHSLVESVAGFSAGIVSTLAVHPFDVIKTRLQRQSSSDPSLPYANTSQSIGLSGLSLATHIAW